MPPTSCRENAVCGSQHTACTIMSHLVNIAPVIRSWPHSERYVVNESVSYSRGERDSTRDDVWSAGEEHCAEKKTRKVS